MWKGKKGEQSEPTVGNISRRENLAKQYATRLPVPENGFPLLEGQITRVQQMEKRWKVEGWMVGRGWKKESGVEALGRNLRRLSKIKLVPRPTSHVTRLAQSFPAFSCIHFPVQRQQRRRR